MKKIEQVFYEFMNLAYNKRAEMRIEQGDILLKGGIIARCSDSGIKVHYLTNGNSIHIPKEWLNIFDQFNTHSGERVLYINSLENLNDVSYIIYKFLRLIIYFETKNGEKFLNTLGDICTTKTKGFRDWFEEKFETTLRPIEFSSLDKTVSI